MVRTKLKKIFNPNNFFSWFFRKTFVEDILVKPGPCNIPIIDWKSFSNEQFLKDFAYQQPFVLRDGRDNTVCTHCSKSSFFVQKFDFDFPRKLLIFFGWKTRENVVVLDFLAVDNFDFTRKIVKKIFGWKTRENVGVLSKLNYWTKWLFE